MGRRPLVLGAALWLAVVVVVSVATWTVIDAAGRDVTARPASDPAAAGVPASTSTAAPSPTARATTKRRPHRSPGATVTRRPTPAATTTPTTAPTTAPTTVPSTARPAPAPTAAATTRAPSPRPSPRPAAPVAEERTWAGRAGSVTARCTGGRIALTSATPADGWRMEVEERGPGRVRVELHAVSGERAGEGSEDGGEDSVDVVAECSGGVPRFRVQT